MQMLVWYDSLFNKITKRSRELSVEYINYYSIYVGSMAHQWGGGSGCGDHVYNSQAIAFLFDMMKWNECLCNLNDNMNAPQIIRYTDEGMVNSDVASASSIHYLSGLTTKRSCEFSIDYIGMTACCT